MNKMKHLRKVKAYRVGNKLHRTKKAARKDAGKEDVGIDSNPDRLSWLRPNTIRMQFFSIFLKKL